MKKRYFNISVLITCLLGFIAATTMFLATYGFVIENMEWEISENQKQAVKPYHQNTNRKGVRYKK